LGGRLLAGPSGGERLVRHERRSRAGNDLPARRGRGPRLLRRGPPGPGTVREVAAGARCAHREGPLAFPAGPPRPLGPPPAPRPPPRRRPTGGQGPPRLPGGPPQPPPRGPEREPRHAPRPQADRPPPPPPRRPQLGRGRPGPASQPSPRGRQRGGGLPENP